MRLRVFLFALAVPIAHAQETSPPPSQDPIVAVNREVFAGIGGQRLQYTETIGDTFADSEIGKQGAGNLGASWMGSALGVQDAWAQGQFEFARGKTAYTGFLQNLQTGATIPYDSSTDVETADWQLRLGRGFENDERDGMLTPFVAVGAHRWVRDGTKSDPYGYLEIYHHAFAEAGFLAQGRFSPQLVGTLGLDAGSTFGAQIAAPALDVSTQLKHERMLGCTFALDYSPIPHLHLKAEYRDVSFRYGRSAVSSTFHMYEPDSYSYQSTAFLSIGFGF
jgi:hypothetical protein